MNIILKSLKIKNFKGIKDMSIDFGRVTNIYGENATGKTTIFDAFTWLLFDKDSRDRKDFDIKTIDNNGNVIHGLEHEVTGVLNVDGTDITLSKIYKEKWARKRGEATKEFTGHTTLYHINGVPVKKSEYQKKINDIIDENLFKLISNPLYFSNMMKWQDRRKVLLDIIGDITEARIIEFNCDLKALEQLLVDKDIDTLKKSIMARKKALNDEIKSIPYRIDELNNSIHKLDFEALEFRKRGIIAAIKNTEDKLLNSSKINEEFLKKQDKLYKLKSKLKDIEYVAKDKAEEPLKQLEFELREAEKEKSKLKMQLYKLETDIASKESFVSSIEEELEKLRNEWNLVNQETLNIPEESFICPTCKRPLEEHDIKAKKTEMIENFNQNKAEKLAAINTTGKQKKEKMEEFKFGIERLKIEKNSAVKKIEEVNEILAERKAKIDNFTPSIDLENNKEYQEVLKQIKELETKLSSPRIDNEIKELKIKKMQLDKELEEINSQLAYKEQNEKTKVRIKELMDKEKELAQKMAELEGQEFLCEEFIKTKVELLEDSINSKFKHVSFKLFDMQINGGLSETCEALINGVPFGSANTASQINAGLDIINTLTKHYNISTPVIIDNRESINKLIECNSQIINLIVSKDKKIRVEGI
ncbi:chromosome partition protein Smc [Clostridium tepidiprofundi DSM 19306]|uniref:Nuclease SbcCD subunit C n=1 Tax=Clostridium tepidiprofundi DSM 19306 TaxID=1121338 RepID=A0A151B889_9CLOT|nr:DUF2813 domain-containing protein [Clostridium tepidiprofundi]KYH35867.1 chromosome partition protein Smc [Clostridium tepidiprofundi DSM 19306]